MKRREFVQAGLIAGGALILPQFSFAAQPRNLVFIHLSGGNDWYNTLIPYSNPDYRRLRPRLAIAEDQIIPIHTEVGLHPALKPLEPQFRSGQITPIKIRSEEPEEVSHTQAAAEWQARWETFNPVHLSVSPGGFMTAMQDAAEGIMKATSPSVYAIGFDGFDTHSFQRPRHDELLAYYAEGVSAAVAKLPYEHQQNTLFLTWTEFGRAMKENAARGTDHGAENYVLVQGRGVRGVDFGDGRAESLQGALRGWVGVV